MRGVRRRPTVFQTNAVHVPRYSDWDGWIVIDSKGRWFGRTLTRRYVRINFIKFCYSYKVYKIHKICLNGLEDSMIAYPLETP